MSSGSGLGVSCPVVLGCRVLGESFFFTFGINPRTVDKWRVVYLSYLGVRNFRSLVDADPSIM